MNETENAVNQGSLETQTLGISGMTCDKCAARVEKALRGVSGVKEVEVDRQAASATVTFDSVVTDALALRDAVLKSGYRPTELPA